MKYPFPSALLPWVAFILYMWSSWWALHFLFSIYSNEYSLFSGYFQHLVNLFARLATDNIGYIDWDPYVPKVTVLISLHALLILLGGFGFLKHLWIWKLIYASVCFSCCQIFTRILRSLNLPVGSNQVVVPRFLTNAYDVGHAVMWITAMMVSNYFIKWNKN